MFPLLNSHHGFYFHNENVKIKRALYKPYLMTCGSYSDQYSFVLLTNISSLLNLGSSVHIIFAEILYTSILFFLDRFRDEEVVTLISDKDLFHISVKFDRRKRNTEIS